MIEHFPDLYPDEILYSAWARYSDQVRYTTRTDVFRELFERRALNTVVDLPCHLGSFIDKLPHGHKYGVDYIIDYHTLLPFYRPFLPQERFDRLREQMITGSGQAIHRRAGVASSNIKRSPWLRYCPKCVEEDRERYGECYWHRLHVWRHPLFGTRY